MKHLDFEKMRKTPIDELVKEYTQDEIQAMASYCTAQARLKPKIEIDFKKISAIEFGGINHKDYPKYCDAYISACDYDGREATDDELEVINDASDFVHEKLQDYLY